MSLGYRDSEKIDRSFETGSRSARVRSCGGWKKRSGALSEGLWEVDTACFGGLGVVGMGSRVEGIDYGTS